jgi:hypothetical protein
LRIKKFCNKIETSRVEEREGREGGFEKITRKNNKKSLCKSSIED